MDVETSFHVLGYWLSVHACDLNSSSYLWDCANFGRDLKALRMSVTLCFSALSTDIASKQTIYY